MSTNVDDLDRMGLLAADRAYLDHPESTTAERVRHAIAAYLATQGTLGQFIVSLPDDHPDLPGGQVLARTFDQGRTWEFCTRPDHYATWSIGVQAVTA